MAASNTASLEGGVMFKNKDEFKSKDSYKAQRSAPARAALTRPSRSP